MPRASQSREGGIVHYFKTADLAIAVVVLGLAKEAVAERQTRSKEAKARAVRPDPVSTLSRPVAAKPAAATAPKKKAKKRKARKPQPAAQIEGAGSVYDENDLNG